MEFTNYLNVIRNVNDYEEIKSAIYYLTKKAEDGADLLEIAHSFQRLIQKCYEAQEQTDASKLKDWEESYENFMQAVPEVIFNYGVALYNITVINVENEEVHSQLVSPLSISLIAAGCLPYNKRVIITFRRVRIFKDDHGD